MKSCRQDAAAKHQQTVTRVTLDISEVSSKVYAIKEPISTQTVLKMAVRNELIIVNMFTLYGELKLVATHV